ncbi:mannose-1-phosphate guanyltransferase alpha-A-like [Tropilaelaps mercedesae]|uniref:Mannose-1-phosphate guanyltransferase alpha-A-like n=1 Tax=Tropilaelaps mercedesae TaxID=418985 RepID=A0A1V9XSJ7_9ACAR|nr:mannose-1-phosphate guanyltransferase alpha-A-like [Tropilaelaps mercedesae]
MLVSEIKNHRCRMLKAVILIGGPQKGTRFRPLSFDFPKPLFPVAGFPVLQHLIEACCVVPDMMEILLIGFYPADQIASFVQFMSRECSLPIRYLQEFTPLGTAGGVYHFRDQIRSGGPDTFLLVNGDVCGDFPLEDLVKFHLSRPKTNLITVLGTEAARSQSVNYGCLAVQQDSGEILHYVEKPSTFVSSIINCGVYACCPEIFVYLGRVYNSKQATPRYGVGSGDDAETISLEFDVLTKLAGGAQKCHVFQTERFWTQIKTAGSAIYANRHYLEMYRNRKNPRLASHTTDGPKIIGDAYIDPTATVHPTAVIGPNVSISQNVTVGRGVRICESIILGNATIGDHSLVKNSIVGWNSDIGSWSRVEGTPCDPNPNKPFSKMDNVPLFNNAGRLNPSITVLGCNVSVPSETVVINSIVLPHKDLNQSYKNEIIL